MHAAAERGEKFLQRECGDPHLRVKWDSRVERFVIGREVNSLAASFIEWFLVLTDGESGYRPIDQRAVRKVLSLDTWRRGKKSEAEFVKQIEDSKKSRAEKRSEILRYRLKHEARYIKKAAQQDGYV